MFDVGMESLVCPTGKQPCEPSDCIDSTIQGCNVSNGIVECVNSCYGTSYLNSRYGYNNVKIYSKNEYISDIKKFSLGFSFYDPCRLSCYSDTLL